jgi:hypothetical protein
MTHTARAELTNVVRRRYCAAAGAEKRRILDEFIAVTREALASAVADSAAGLGAQWAFVSRSAYVTGSTHSLSALPQERSSVDRAEKRRCLRKLLGYRRLARAKLRETASALDPLAPFRANV